MRNNEITELPESIGNITSLQFIELRLNKIKTIPKSIGKLVDVNINLSHNKLTYLQLDIKNVKKIYIFPSSYDDFDKLSNDCEYLQVEKLNVPLKNLPLTIKEIRLTKIRVKIIDIKVPFGCQVFIDNIQQ